MNYEKRSINLGFLLSSKRRHTRNLYCSLPDLVASAAVVDSMAGFALNQNQEDYLEAAAHFVDEYDRKTNSQLSVATGVDVLRELLDARGMGGAGLSRILGVSRNVGAMILRGERSLTLDHVRCLSEEFKVAPGVFV